MLLKINEMLELRKSNDLDLSSLKVEELKTVCKENGFKGYSKLRKAELVDFIERELDNLIPVDNERENREMILDRLTEALLFEDSNDFRNANAMYQELRDNWTIFETLSPDSKLEILKKIYSTYPLYPIHEELECLQNCILKREWYNIEKNIPVDKVTVYRGIGEYNNNFEKGNCWTLSKEKAEWFANRGSKGKVLQMVVDKEAILYYYNNRNENEVYILDDYIKDYKVVA